MQNAEKGRGARHRLLVLMYIACLTWSLAPAMVAPAEKEFAQGQPEMQLAMDNMVAHQTFVQKRTPADYHNQITSKISNCLLEAEQMLNSLPTLKHRKWIEEFIRHMRAMAAMLEKENDNNISTESLNSTNGTPVPESLHLHPTWPTPSAVLEMNSFQKSNKMMSKFAVTSPELSKVLQANDGPSERQAVTKPAVSPTKMEEAEETDELVRELENLHLEILQQASSQNSMVLDETSTVTMPSTVLPLETTENPKSTNAEDQKEILKNKLIEGILEYHRLGGEIPKEVIHAIYKNNMKEPAKKNINMDDTIKFTEAGMVDRQGFQRIDDSSHEDKEISHPNVQNIPRQLEEHPQMKFNRTFQYMYPNFHPNLKAFPRQMGHYMYYVSPQNRGQAYQGYVGNGVQGLPKSNSIIPGNYRGMVAPINQQLGHIPDAIKQMMPRPQNNLYNGHLANPDYYNYLMRHGSGPYPYMHSSDFENATIPESPKQHMNHKIDTQLSDEMKRELRDGKIIVLSDSVVRSNFEPNENDKTTESTTETQKSENEKQG